MQRRRIHIVSILAAPLCLCAVLLLALIVSLGAVTSPVAVEASNHILYVTKNTPSCGVFHPWCDANRRFATIQAAVDAANAGDEIRVAADTYTDVATRTAPPGYAGTDVITQAVFISKSLTVRGGYHYNDFDTYNPSGNVVTVDAVNNGRVFVVAGDATTVGLTGLQITQGDATTLRGGIGGTDAGGGVYVLSSTVTLEDVTIYDNDAAEGAGVYVRAGTLTLDTIELDDTVVRDNSATSSGGGVQIVAGSATVHNTQILRNSAPAGGGLFLDDSDLSGDTGIEIRENEATGGNGGGVSATSGAVSLSDSSLHSNTAASNGGGIYADSSALTLTGGVDFSGNAATADGGGIYLKAGTLSLSNATLTDQAAANGGAIYAADSRVDVSVPSLYGNRTTSGSGGAIYVTGGELNLNSTSVSTNTAQSDGGALYAAGAVVTLTIPALYENEATDGSGGAVHLAAGTLRFIGNTTFTSNTAGMDGGALAATNGSTVSAPGVTLEQNGAGGNGGAFAVDGTLTLPTATVRQNTAGNNGGGIYLANGAAGVDSLTMTWNHAATNGGGLHATNGTITVASGTIFSNTLGSGSGAAMYVSGGLTLRNADVYSHTAPTDGGALFIDGDLTLDGVTAYANSAGNQGGAVYARNGSGTLQDNTFYGNEAQIGGALSLDSMSLTSSGDNTIRDNGAASGSGGGIYATDTVLELGTLTMYDNRAVRDGGGVHATSSDIAVTGGTIFSNTIGNGSGAAMYVDGSLILHNADVYSHTAPADGGALFVDGDLTLKGVTAYANSAGNRGGAVYANNGSGVFQNNTVYGNDAKIGGAFFFDSVSLSSSGDNTIRNNEATAGSGGGVHATDTALELGTLTMQDNRAVSDGGGIHAASSVITITGGTIYSNTIANGSGAGIHITGGKLSLQNSDVYSHTAPADGGAVFVDGDLTLDRVTAYANSAGNRGGALYATSGSGAFQDNTFYDNEAQIGGALSFDGMILTASGDNTIRNNEATAGSGGGLFATGGTLELGTVTMHDNRAASDGGGIHAASSVISITGGTIYSNTIRSGSGGGVHILTGSLTIENTAVYSHTAPEYGGALYVIGDLTLKGTTVATNTARLDGGGVYATGGGGALVDSAFFNNRARSGGALYFDGVDLTADGENRVEDNEATDGSGGGVYLTDGAAAFGALTLARNRAVQDGAGIHAIDGVITIVGGSIISNTVEAGSGAGIHVTGGELTLNGATVMSHTAPISGGAVYVRGAPVTIDGSTFMTNTAQAGGAVYLEAGSLVARDVGAHGNTAQTNGGGFYVRDSTVEFAGTGTIVSNTVTSGDGGGLYMHTITGTIEGLTAGKNRARYGGGLYALDGTISISGSRFYTNTATQRGGGLYLDVEQSAIRSSTIEENIADRGGGLYLEGGRPAITDTVVQGNTSNLRRTFLLNRPVGVGAGMYIRDAQDLNFVGNRVLSNTIPLKRVTEQVAVITETIVITYPKPDGDHAVEVIEEGPRFETRNVFDNGGGLYVISSTGALTDNVFMNNTASHHGGAMVLDGSRLDMVNNVLVQNTVGVSTALGSGVYISSTHLSLAHNTIADNAHLELDGEGVNAAFQLAGAGSWITMTNNVLANHQIGIRAERGSTVVGTNNVWWQHTDRDWSGDLFDLTTPHVFGDPKFVGGDPAGRQSPEDYRIGRDSAAFDAGVAQSADFGWDGIAVDIAGNPRPRAFGVDAGAYEHRYQEGLYLRQSATPAVVDQGMTITYAITVVNHSPTSIANVHVLNTLPAEQSLQQMTSSRGSCSGASCDLGTLAPEATAQVSVVAEVTGDPQPGGVVPMEHTVDVTFTGADAVDSDRTSTYTTYLQARYQEDDDPGDPGEPDDPFYTGACRIHFGGTEYDSLQKAIAATSEDSDVIKVSGYCAGFVQIVDPLLPAFTIQGGWSTDLRAHDPELYPTTLDALGQNRVLFVAGESVAPAIEDLDLVNGRAGSTIGGGVYLEKTGATLRNVRIAGSQANYGGGLYVNTGQPTLQQITVEDNSAAVNGAGVYLFESGAQLEEFTIRNNTGATDGGGIYFDESGAGLVESTVEGHTVKGRGGGIYLDRSPASVVRSTVRDNTAKAGGGVFTRSSQGSIAQSRIENNTATASPLFVLIWPIKPGGGGGIYAERSDLIVQNNVIRANSAGSGDGAGIHIWDARQPRIDGNVIADNQGGHGVYLRLTPAIFEFWIALPPLRPPPLDETLILPLEQPDPIRMRHNTIARNAGSGVFVYGQTSVELANNIFWQNSSDGLTAETEVFPHIIAVVIPVPPGLLVPIPIPVPTFYPPEITMSRTMWGNESVSASVSGAFSVLNAEDDLSGASCLHWHYGDTFGPVPDGDCTPAFRDPDAGDYHIKRISPAFQTGTTSDVTMDVDGENHIQGGYPDIGADEYTYRRTRYAAPNGGDDGHCLNYVNPCSLQAAIDAAQAGDLVKVAEGIYGDVLTRNGQSQVAYVAKSISIQGGYCPSDRPVNGITDCDWERPYPDTYESILDAGGSGRAMYVAGDVEPEIFGLRLTGGNASAAGMDGRGGGIAVIAATATISDVKIYANTANTGGGVYVGTSAATLDASLVTNNVATYGGGIALDADETTVVSSTISLNRAGRGAGVHLTASAATFVDNSIHSNTDATQGGGIYVRGGEAQFRQNALSNNAATHGAGGYLLDDESQIISNTLSTNDATENGGGFHLDASKAQIIGNELRHNRATTGAGFFLDSVSDGLIRANNVHDNTASGDGGGLKLQFSTNLLEENAISKNEARDGAGIHLSSFSGATLESNSVAENEAGGSGGGIYIKQSAATVYNNTVVSNTATTGAGLYTRLNGTAIISNTIGANTAGGFGGGIYAHESTSTFEKNVVTGNSAGNAGGIYLRESSSAQIRGTTIAENAVTGSGAGLYLDASNAALSDLTVLTNTAGIDGGGAYLRTSVATLDRILVQANSAGQGAGLYLADESHATLTNDVIVDNQGDSGVYVAGSSPTLRHTTFARNGGAGLYATDLGGTNSTVQFTNTIMVSHTIGVEADGSNILQLNATLWHGNGTDWQDSPFITTDDDLFADPDFVDGYHLSRRSPAMNEGVDAGVTEDVDGEYRPQGDGPDLGADEVPADCFAKVTSDMDPTYTILQEAVDAAQPGDTVKVAGACLGVQRRDGRTQSLYVTKSITVQGGYSATNWIDADPVARPTIVDPQGNGRVVYISGNVSPVLAGLTLSGGNPSGQGGGPDGQDAGGGVYVDRATATITNSMVTGNSAPYGAGIYLDGSATTVVSNTIAENGGNVGAGLFLRESAATIDRNVVEKNTAAADGGGFFLSRSPAIVRDNTIRGNGASAGGGLFLESSDATLERNEVTANNASSGGGLYLDSSSATLTRNNVTGNEADNGGGLYLVGSPATLDGNTLTGNRVENNGGALYLEGSDARIVNSVVAQNEAGTSGSAAYVQNSSPLLLHDTFVGNSGGDGSGIFVEHDAGTVTVRNTIVAGHGSGIDVGANSTADLDGMLWSDNGADTAGSGTVTVGDSVIEAPPDFVAAGSGDYHLARGSPAINAGVVTDVTVDIDGQPRPIGDAFDIGADEFFEPRMVATVSGSRNPAVAGTELTYAFNVDNLGNADLHTSITATLPLQVEPSGTITWTDQLIPIGSKWEQNVTVIVDEGFEGTLVTQIEASAREGASDSATSEVSVEPPAPALSLSHSASSASTASTLVEPGANLTYDVRVGNSGNVPLNATVTVTLPSQVLPNDPHIWSAQLGRGDSTRRFIDVTVPITATGDLISRVDVTTEEGVTESNVLTITVAEPALDLALTGTPREVEMGAPLAYTAIVTNTGTGPLTAFITDTLPPYVTPSGEQTWQPAIDVGEVWQETIVVTAPTWYLGPLTNELRVTTDEGPAGTVTDTVQVVLNELEPTIQSIGSGDWTDASNWEPARAPHADDIVLVNADHHLTMPLSVTLDSLINYGMLGDCMDGRRFSINVTGQLRNYGLIAGADGADGTADTPAEPGCSIALQAQTILNEGDIVAGAGGNAGDIGDPGAGGEVLLLGGAGGPGQILNTGTIAGGDGGDGNPDADEPQDGAPGGDVTVFATPVASLLGGEITAGSGGAGTGGGDDGTGGSVGIGGGDGATVTLDGVSVSGHDVQIYAGDDGTIDLSGLDAGAMTADGDIDVVAGEGSTIEPADEDALTAGGTVRTRTDEILYVVKLMGPGQVDAYIGRTTSVDLLLFNLSPKADTYTFMAADTAGWTLGGLPDSLAVPAGAAHTVTLTIRPDGAQSDRDTYITATATSPGSGAGDETTLRAIAEGIPPVYIPFVTR